MEKNNISKISVFSIIAILAVVLLVSNFNDLTGKAVNDNPWFGPYKICEETSNTCRPSQQPITIGNGKYEIGALFINSNSIIISVVNTKECINTGSVTACGGESSPYLSIEQTAIVNGIEIKIKKIVYGSNNYVTFMAKETEVTCTDSDGGKDYYTKGQLNNELEDYCMSDFLSVAEYYCDSNIDTGFNKEFYKCPNGCKDGACIVPSSGGGG